MSLRGIYFNTKTPCAKANRGMLLKMPEEVSGEQTTDGGAPATWCAWSRSIR